MDIWHIGRIVNILDILTHASHVKSCHESGVNISSCRSDSCRRAHSGFRLHRSGYASKAEVSIKDIGDI